MKKLLSLLLASLFTFACFSFTGCFGEQPGTEKQVNISYKDAPTIMQLLLDDGLDYGLLPEPAASTLEKVKGKDFTWKRLSLQDLYDEQAKSYPQAVLMVKNDVLEAYPQIVRQMKEKFNDNITWVNQNPKLAVSAIKTNFTSSTLNPNVMDSSVIENCKISWQDASLAKKQVNDYISNILSANDSQLIVPAKTVGDDFFYTDNGAQGQAINGKTFTFYAPDGAPALAIAKFINDNEGFVSGATFNYNVVVADDIAKYTNGVLGTADFVVMPVNAASKIYKNVNANYTMVSVITHGNLYIMAKVKDGNTQIKLSDLDGKKIGVIGQGNVPDLTLKTVLAKNSIGYSVIG